MAFVCTILSGAELNSSFGTINPPTTDRLSHEQTECPSISIEPQHHETMHRTVKLLNLFAFVRSSSHDLRSGQQFACCTSVRRRRITTSRGTEMRIIRRRCTQVSLNKQRERKQREDLCSVDVAVGDASAKPWGT